MAVKKGDKVKVEYEGTLDDGTVFDSTSIHDEPLIFEVGAGVLMEGFEDAVVGMEINDEKELKLTPSEAYGDYKNDLVKTVPRDQLPPHENLEADMILIMNLPNGIQIPVMVKEVSDDTVTLDLNHPLAGKELTFKIKLLEILT